MNENDKINYVEFPCRDIEATKAFFQAAFSDRGNDGGFFKSDQASVVDNGGALVVLFSDNLEAALTGCKTLEKQLPARSFPFPMGGVFILLSPVATRWRCGLASKGSPHDNVAIVSSFEFLSVLISVVVGLGMANMLTGVGRLLHKRRAISFSLVHLAWSTFVFLMMVVYWWTVVFSWKDWEYWNIFLFLFIFSYGVLLFLLSAILYPSEIPESWWSLHFSPGLVTS